MHPVKLIRTTFDECCCCFLLADDADDNDKYALTVASAVEYVYKYKQFYFLLQRNYSAHISDLCAYVCVPVKALLLFYSNVNIYGVCTACIYENHGVTLPMS